MLFPVGMWRGLVAIIASAPIMGYGMLVTIQTPWGVGPWDVLHLGLAKQLSITVGQANQLTGASLVLLILLLRGRTITVVTVCNVVLVGMWVDIFDRLGWAPHVGGYAGLAYLCLGIVIFGLGIALYLHPDKGAGPRDGLMITLQIRTGQPLYRIKIALDLAALLTGYLLGGPVGIGTVIVAFGLGPVIDGFRRLLQLIEVRRQTTAGAAGATGSPRD